MADVLDRIRAECREVAESARFVHVERDRIAPYAREIWASAPERPVYDKALHFCGLAEDVVAYTVTLDSVNFGSGYFPHVAKRPGASGYGTVARALTDRFESEGAVDAAWLAAATPGDCARIFGQSEADEPVAELMSLFARAWNDLGRDLLCRFDGSFTRLVESANESASRLVAELMHQPLFRDVATYRGRAVSFFKRAQIVASDLALALDAKDWGRFRDLDRLTIFADNLVPHVLRSDGLLTYDKDLADRIERGELIAAGSEEEVEIRACSVQAVELMTAALRDRGATARDLDIALWNRGRLAAYKAVPRHRTRTTDY